MPTRGLGSQHGFKDAVGQRVVLSPQDHRFLDELVKLDNVDLAVEILMSRGAASAGHNAPEEPLAISQLGSCCCASKYPRTRRTVTDDSHLIAPPVEPSRGAFLLQADMLSVSAVSSLACLCHT